MKKILITGINGISGIHLYDRLVGKPDIEVTGTYFKESDTIPLSHFQKATLYHSDILNRESLNEILEKESPEQIYHFAAIVPVMVVNRNVWKAFETNINGTINIIEVAKSVGLKCRILIPGSSDEYGSLPAERLPIIEENYFNPINLYGVTKVAQELTCRQYLQTPDIEFVFTRTFNFMGPYQPDKYVTASFAKQIVETGRDGGDTIKVGNLDIKRDFLDIRDIVSAYDIIMEQGIAGEAYNICSGEGVLISALINRLTELSKTGKVKIEVDPAKVRKVDNPLLLGDNAKLKSLGWKRRYKLDDSLCDILDFWEDRCLKKH